MRMLFYSADSYGLGHVSRTVSIVSHTLGQADDSSALVLTGAPRAHYFAYPDRCDYVKLPSITKDVNGHYVTRDLQLPLGDAIGLRRRLIVESKNSFRPDVVVIDHTARGLGGEALPLLEQSPLCAARRVLGMRDLIDVPERVKADWDRNSVIDVLRHGYDEILVYGQQDFFDPIEAYGIPADVAAKMTFAGYLTRNGNGADVAQIKRDLAPRTGRLVVVTAGGGGDGNVLLRNFLSAYEALGARPPFEAFVVTGPLMSPRKRDRFQSWCGRLDGVGMAEHYENIPSLYRAADLVVSMAGYNTVCELASAGARSLLVPRVFPRREQWLRARLLQERGVARCLEPGAADPERLLREILQGLDAPSPPKGWGLDLDGLDRASRAIRRAAAQTPQVLRRPARTGL